MTEQKNIDEDAFNGMRNIIYGTALVLGIIYFCRGCEQIKQEFEFKPTEFYQAASTNNSRP